MKKRFKVLGIILVIAIFIFSLYNFITYLRCGNQRIQISASNKYDSNSNIEAIISVSNYKNNESIKSNLKSELIDSNDKKVKGVSEVINVEKDETASISMKIPENIKTGNYKLKVTSKSGIWKDVAEVPITITNGADFNATISFDKGIYKPGDAVNFRALITSKKDDTPIKQKLSVSIYDGNDNRVYFENVESSDYGIVSGIFKLATEVNSGNYKLVVSSDSKDVSKEFIVNPYITPQFEVSINTDKENYLLKEKANIEINAKYFFGEPVVGATVKGKISNSADSKEFEGITNSEGKYIFEYDVRKNGQNNIKVSVTDNSNYLIENSKTIYGCTDKFEIEVLPEFGSLIKGIDNDIYIITKTADGNPVKTYTTVTIDKITRQVITNEKGIGKLTLTSSDISELNVINNYVRYNNNYYDYDYDYEDYETDFSNDQSNIVSRSALSIKAPSNSDIDYRYNNYLGVNFNIVSEDMDKNKVETKKYITVTENNSTIIKTNKVKYNTNEDIKIDLYSNLDNAENEIYIYKNNELLKLFSTNDSSIDINLEDVYGLIDIYVKRPNTSYNIYNKRTIFIKPNKALNINIENPKEEYKPGEDLNLKFVTTDESSKNIDSALLVSILDEAILNLAENDLNIDNIKLALEDIELTDGMTAADLYANIVDDNQETAIMGLLLKQSNKNPNIVSNTYNTIDKKELAFTKAIVSFIGLLALVVIFVAIKSKRFSNIAFNLFNLIGIFILMNIIIDPYGLNELLVSAIISFVLYLLLLYKFRDKIFVALLELGVLPLIGVILYELVIIPFNLEDFWMIIALIPAFIWAILTAVSRSKKLSNFWEVCKKFVKTICKVELVYFIAYIITEKFDIYEELWVIVTVLITYIITNVLLNRNSIEKIKNKKISLNISGMELLGGISAIIIIALIIYIYNVANRPLTDSMTSMIDDTSIMMNESRKSDNSGSSIMDFAASSIDTSGTKSSKNSIFDGMEEALDNITSSVTQSDSVNSTSQSLKVEEDMSSNNDIVQNIETEKEEKVRNVFLESLAFIPELVTQNGEAKANIKISDNITTWNIQAVGNTKSGNVGYASSKFKVFKEFFINYSLPTNSVVSDKISVPVTLYNYTENELDIAINVIENSWSKIGEYKNSVKVPSNNTVMIYIPIEIISSGNNKLRIEAKALDISDIVEKEFEVKPNGFEKQEVVSSGMMEKTLSQDIIFNEDYISETGKIKVKLYPSSITQALEGIENIFKMPTGCFEQTSSSLYPNVLALKYLKDNKLDDEKIKERALNYISSGYQRLLTFEVRSEKGGYSLYGDAPAETVITAFGLMELKDLSEVYEIDENVLNNMKEFLFKKQKSNGSFDYSSTYIGGAAKTNDLAMSAYISWALSEAYPDDSRLQKSVKYLENNIDKMDDNYTLALVANVFANTNNKNANEIINKLLKNVINNGDKSYVTSSIRDYYGSYGITQNIQTTALTSMALTKLNSNSKVNGAFINYIVSSKDTYGTWGTTQATVLSLKAINDFSSNSDVSKQTISVKMNDEVKDIKIDENAIDLYELTFDNINKENNISIDMKKGKIYYEIIKEYYIDYNNVDTNNNDIKVSSEITNQVKVNDIIMQKITVTNNSKDLIYNGMIEISIPQGCSVLEESLMELEYKGLIEKYEYNYGKIKLYLRNFENMDNKTLEVKYRALYPENITGTSIRAYDYYNPNVEGFVKPVNIVVNE